MEANLLMSLLIVRNGKTIINICSTKFLFKQSTGNIEDIIDFFSLSEGAEEILTMANPGECIFSLNNNVTAMRFHVAEFEEEFVYT